MKHNSLSKFLTFSVILFSVSNLAEAAAPRMKCGGTMTETDGNAIPLRTNIVLADDVDGYREKILDFDISARLSATGSKTITVISTFKRKPRELGHTESSGESLSLRVSEKNHGSVSVNCQTEQ